MLKPAERSAPTRWRSRAFGLELESAIAVPGLPELGAGPGRPATRLELASGAALDHDWPSSDAVRLLEEADTGRTIDHHPTAGYRMHAPGYGVARVDPDGTLIRCTPPELEPWRWQRFLMARVLPCASVLRGLEVFHASAVAMNGRTIGFIGPSGAGKTSLALELVAAGAEFVTDDVLAIDQAPEGALRAHPGASIVSVRDTELHAATGQLLGRDDKAYVSLVRAQREMPLGAIYFLTRRPGVRSTHIDHMTAPDPSVLMASTFVFAIQTPSRLENLLDISAQLARSVPTFRIELAEDVTPPALASRVREHAVAAVTR